MKFNACYEQTFSLTSLFSNISAGITNFSLPVFSGLLKNRKFPPPPSKTTKDVIGNVDSGSSEQQESNVQVTPVESAFESQDGPSLLCK